MIFWPGTEKNLTYYFVSTEYYNVKVWKNYWLTVIRTWWDVCRSLRHNPRWLCVKGHRHPAKRFAGIWSHDQCGSTNAFWDIYYATPFVDFRNGTISHHIFVWFSYKKPHFNYKNIFFYYMIVTYVTVYVYMI